MIFLMIIKVFSSNYTSFDEHLKHNSWGTSASWLINWKVLYVLTSDPLVDDCLMSAIINSFDPIYTRRDLLPCHLFLVYLALRITNATRRFSSTLSIKELNSAADVIRVLSSLVNKYSFVFRPFFSIIQFKLF